MVLAGSRPSLQPSIYRVCYPEPISGGKKNKSIFLLLFWQSGQTSLHPPFQSGKGLLRVPFDKLRVTRICVPLDRLRTGIGGFKPLLLILHRVLHPRLAKAL